MSNTEQSSKEQIQEEWSAGSYPTLARSFLGVGATLVDAAGVEKGERVLDVASGTGNVAITAYRRGGLSPVSISLRRCSIWPENRRQ